jgi:hypothetical protein
MTPEEALATLDSSNLDEVILALEWLSYHRCTPAVPKLAAMLDSPLVDVRLIVRVVKTLSEINSPLAMDILKAYLYAGTTQISTHQHDQTTFERLTRADIVHEAVKKAFKAIDTQEARAVLVDWQQRQKWEKK